MILVFYLLVILISLVQMTVFHGSVIYGAIVIAFSVFAITTKYILKKKLSKFENALSIFTAVAILLVAGFGMGARSEESVTDYYTGIAKVQKMIEAGEYNKAEDEIRKMTETYGDTDKTHMVAALNSLAQGDYQKAQQEYAGIRDKNSALAYVIREKILVSDPQTDQKTFAEFYADAADRFPEWESMQVMCGYTKLGQKQYKEAEYYLVNAYGLNCENPMTCYYLGAVFYYEGKTDEALEYFDHAVEFGADDKTKSQIKWFLKEMGYQG